MCRTAKRQVLDEEWQRTSSMLPIMDVAYQRGREVGERRAHDGVRVTIVRCGRGQTTLFFLLCTSRLVSTAPRIMNIL
jgi:hypothetical protein